MAQLCPACNTQNPDGSVFCIHCGGGMAPTGGLGNPSGYGYQQPAMAQQSQIMYPGSQSPVQMGTVGGGQDQWKYRRAFAGYGIPVMHHSWLLDGKDVQVATLRTAIMELWRPKYGLRFQCQSCL